MVLSFPAAKAAPQPLCSLLASMVGFLEGFEDDPDQCEVPHLLRDLRHAQESELVALPAPAPCSFHFSDEIDFVTNRKKGKGGYSLRRHDPIGADQIGRWCWTATRYDDEGRAWHTSGIAVIDDFGNLVEVRA